MTTAERNSLAYQAGPLLIKQREAADLRRAGATYRELAARFGVSRETVRKWVKKHMYEAQAGPIIERLVRAIAGMLAADEPGCEDTRTARRHATQVMCEVQSWIRAGKEATDKESLSVGAATTEQSSADHLRDAAKMMEVQP